MHPQHAKIVQTQTVALRAYMWGLTLATESGDKLEYDYTADCKGICS